MFSVFFIFLEWKWNAIIYVIQGYTDSDRESPYRCRHWKLQEYTGGGETVKK